MGNKNKSDLFIYIIGIAIVGFILFKTIGYILPDQEPDYDGTALLEAVMDKNGGKDAWSSLQKMSYKKSFQLFYEDGSIEKDLTENHAYDFTEGINREVTWSQEDTLYEIHRSDSAIYQIKNGKLDTLVTPKQLQSKLDAATFVVGLPFTLDTSSASLTYEGKTAFQNTPCHVLKVTFQGSEDVWYLYYEEGTLSWIGYWVQTSGHYSLVINEEMTDVNGFILSRKRKSYRTDAQQNPTYLRATYKYENYDLE
ncbi:hypothetical protein ACFO3O_18230 [Dokdonia ponticola]|uniref:Uncharacterized protein n=1 Tax=Dokdonia ponticola TaxID=2041041 RepID=A0ABV9I3N7_9FLAO